MKNRYTVIAKPGSSMNSVTSEGDVLVVRTTRHAHGGEANHSIIEQLAEHFHVSKSAVRILLGSTAREKLVEVITEE